MFVDLHLHSLKSDGIYSPKEVVKDAHSLGIKTISLTDHDTYSGLYEAAEMANTLGMNFYGGIEFTVHETENHYEHILAYGIKDFTSIDEYLSKLKQEKINLVNRYIDILQTNGFENISFDAVARLSSGDYVTILNVKRWIDRNCDINTSKDAYSLLMGTNGKYLLSEPYHYYDEIIPLIRNAGGVAILAHPFRYHPKFRDDVDAFEKHIAYLVSCGLSGIEAYYGTHSRKETHLCIKMAKKYNLIVTGGSDTHGWDDEVPMGVCIPSKHFNKFTNLI